MSEGVSTEASGGIVQENKDETPVASVEWKEQLSRLRREIKKTQDDHDD